MRWLVLTLFGCPPPPEETDTDTVDDAFPVFALGVEYTQVGLADPYAGVGVSWAKTRLEAMEWRTSQPTAPAGSVAVYDWSCPDAHIVGFQERGVRNIQAYLSPRSPWGSVDAAGAAPRDIMVADAHEAAFRAWVRAMVERYDGDGTDDAPGLIAPVRYWVVGPEWTGFWPSGDHEDYLRFATWVHEEATAAYPDVRLGTIPFLFTDEFAGNEPTDEQIEERMGPPFVLRNGNDGIAAVLDHPELFHYVNLHALGDYTEVPPMVRWVRGEMGDRGYELPIWFDDAFPTGILANNANYPANYPVTSANYADVFATLRSVARQDDVQGPDPDDATAWIRAYTATHTVKKVVTTLGEGVTGVQLGNLEDWFLDPGAPAFRDATVALIGASAMMGMTDVAHPGGYDLCDTRTPGAARPALVNLGLLVDLLGDGDFEVRQRIGGNEGARGYRFERGGVPLWVLWAEDGLLHLPGDAAETPVPYSLFVSDDLSQVRLTESVTTAGEEPTVSDVALVDGTVVVQLTSAPVFVSPSP